MGMIEISNYWTRIIGQRRLSEKKNQSFLIEKSTSFMSIVPVAS